MHMYFFLWLLGSFIITWNFRQLVNDYKKLNKGGEHRVRSFPSHGFSSHFSFFSWKLLFDQRSPPWILLFSRLRSSGDTLTVKKIPRVFLSTNLKCILSLSLFLQMRLLLLQRTTRFLEWLSTNQDRFVTFLFLFRKLHLVLKVALIERQSFVRLVTIGAIWSSN